MKEIKNKIFGFLGGFILIFLGIIMLWFNEGRTAKTESTIKEARNEYIEIKSDSIDEKNENKLVTTTGQINLNDEVLTDPIFQISVPTAKLYRKVEMYQWEETCETNDDNTRTCHYGKVWSEELIDSSNFAQPTFENPTEMKYQSEIFYNENTKIGAFTLGNTFLEKLSTKQQVTELNREIAPTLGLIIDDDYTYTDGNVATGGLHSVGNIRVSFYYNDAKTLSIMAVQSNNSFKEYQSSTGYKIAYLSETTKTGEEILTDLTAQNNLFKWLFRILGIIFIVSGFSALASPLQTIASFVPFFGGIVRWVFGWIASSIGLALSFIIIALAWLRYRPLISITLLLGATIIVVLCILIIKKNKEKNKKEEEITNQQELPITPTQSDLSILYNNPIKQPGNPFQNHQISQNITTGAAKPPQQIQQQPVNTNQQQTNNNQINLQEFYHNQQQNNQNNQ